MNGRYDADTDDEVRLWQEQVCGDKPDPAGKSYLGPNQFKAMFPDAVYTLHDDGDPAVAGGSPETPRRGTTLGTVAKGAWTSPLTTTMCLWAGSQRGARSSS